MIQVYGGEGRISALRKLFPQIEDKKSLASAVERAQIKGKASLSAAVDYYVSMHSDIFVSASPGNMHNAMVHKFLGPINIKSKYGMKMRLDSEDSSLYDRGDECNLDVI